MADKDGSRNVPDKDEMVFEARTLGGGVKIRDNRALETVVFACLGVGVIILAGFGIKYYFGYKSLKVVAATASAIMAAKSSGPANSNTCANETFEEKMMSK